MNFSVDNMLMKKLFTDIITKNPNVGVKLGNSIVKSNPDFASVLNSMVEEISGDLPFPLPRFNPQLLQHQPTRSITKPIVNKGVIPNPTITPHKSVTKPKNITNQGGVMTEIEKHIKNASEKYGVPVNLIKSVIKHESGFNPKSVSRAGAKGLMQLMPKTARGLGVTNPFDISQNIDAGVRYLKQQLDKFGSVPLALAAYNAGPRNVEKHGGIPPFAETKKYVNDILKSLQLIK